MKYKAVIFDMDGLILDTEIIEHRSFEILLKEYGKEPKPLATGLIHEPGKAGPSYYENFKNQYNLDENIDVIRDKKRAYWAQIVEDERIESFPGFVDLLKLLKKRKYIIALASNRNEKFINLILDKLNVRTYFDLIIGPGEDRKHKPSPDIYIHAAKELKTHPSECIALEDSDVGVKSAKDAGMKVIAVPNTYTKDHDFSRADVIVKSLKDINMELLENL